MTRRRRIAIGGVVAVLLAVAVALILLLSPGTDETATLQPDAAVTLVDIEIDAGAITLVPAETLTVTIGQHAGRFAPTPSSSTEVTDEVLHVVGTCPRLGVGRCHTPVTLAIPPGIAIRASTRAGSIDGEIVRNPVQATTTAGSISLNVTGEVTQLSAMTDAGRVDLIVPDDVYAVDARTSLGRTLVEVDTADDALRTIHARSEVGRISIRTPQDTR